MEISARRELQFVVVRVDNGPGIPADMREANFRSVRHDQACRPEPASALKRRGASCTETRAISTSYRNPGERNFA